MDNNAGDLAHAAEDIKMNVEKDSVYNLSNEELRVKNSQLEKSEVVPDSSAASSDDGQQLRKPDSRVLQIKEDKNDEEAYAHLPPHERDVIKKQLEMPTVAVSYLTIFRYATRIDILLIVVSCVSSIAAGAIQPLMTVSCDSKGIWSHVKS